MKKLKYMLIALLAVTMSLALFACGGDGDNGGDEPGPGPNVYMGIDSITLSSNSVSITDTQKKADAEAAINAVKVTVSYTKESGKSAKDLAKNEYTIGAIPDSAFDANGEGIVGTYPITITPTVDNDGDVPETATLNLVIDHTYTGEGAQKECSKDGAVLTSAEGLNEVVNFGPWPTCYAGADNRWVTAFGLNGAGVEVPTATAGRIDKGMTITVYAQVKTIGANDTVTDANGKAIMNGEDAVKGNANGWNVPLIGIANRETNSGFVERWDRWGIYTLTGLNGWTTRPADGSYDAKSDVSCTDGTATTEDAYLVAKSAGTTQVSENFADWTDIVITWNYSDDGMMTWTRTVVSTNASWTITMHVPDRQYYDTVLHGELVNYKITKVEKVQNSALKSVGEPTLAKDVYFLENTMMDASVFSIPVTLSGNKSATADASIIEVFASEDAGKTLPEDNTEKGGKTYDGWTDLQLTKLNKNFKSYKVRVQIADYWEEKVLSANELAKLHVKANAVDHAGGKDVTVSETAFVATGTTAAFGWTDAARGADNAVSVVISGDAAQLTAAQKTALGATTGYVSYVTLSLFKNGPTDFTAAGTPAFTVNGGTAAVPAKANVTAETVDMVLPLNAEVLEKGIKIEGINETAIVVTFNGITGVTVVSTVTATQAKLNETATITLSYNLSGMKDAPATLDDVVSKLVFNVNGSGGHFNKSGTDLTVNFIGLGDFKVTAATYTDKTLAITCAIPAIDPSAPSNYTFRLNTQDGETLASDIWYYTPDFAASNSVTNNTYIVVDGAKAYLMKAFAGSDLKSADIAATLHFAANAGAETGKGEVKEGAVNQYLTNTYLKAHDLSFATANGVVSLTSTDLLKGLATIQLVTFGAIDNSEDSDHGAVVVVTIDLKAIGVRTDGNKEAFAFQIDPETEHRTYQTVTYDADNKVNVISALTEYTTSNHVVLIDGDCAHATEAAYGITVDGKVVFYAESEATYEDHKWKAGADATQQVCEVCGGTKTTVTVDDKNYTYTLTDRTHVDLENVGNGKWWAGNDDPSVLVGVTTLDTSKNFVVVYTYDMIIDSWRDVVFQFVVNGQFGTFAPFEEATQWIDPMAPKQITSAIVNGEEVAEDGKALVGDGAANAPAQLYGKYTVSIFWLNGKMKVVVDFTRYYSNSTGYETGDTLTEIDKDEDKYVATLVYEGFNIPVGGMLTIQINGNPHGASNFTRTIAEEVLGDDPVIPVTPAVPEREGSENVAAKVGKWGSESQETIAVQEGKTVTFEAVFGGASSVWQGLLADVNANNAWYRLRVDPAAFGLNAQGTETATWDGTVDAMYNSLQMNSDKWDGNKYLALFAGNAKVLSIATITLNEGSLVYKLSQYAFVDWATEYKEPVTETTFTLSVGDVDSVNVTMYTDTVSLDLAYLTIK